MTLKYLIEKTDFTQKPAQNDNQKLVNIKRTQKQNLQTRSTIHFHQYSCFPFNLNMNQFGQSLQFYRPTQQIYTTQSYPFIPQQQIPQSYHPTLYLPQQRQPLPSNQITFQQQQRNISSSSLHHKSPIQYIMQDVPPFEADQNDLKIQYEKKEKIEQNQIPQVSNDKKSSIKEHRKKSNIQPILPQQLIDYNDLVKSHKYQNQKGILNDQISLPTNDQTSVHILNNNSSYQLHYDNRSLQSDHIQEIKPIDMSYYQNVIHVDTAKNYSPNDHNDHKVTPLTVPIASISPNTTQEKISFSQRFPVQEKQIIQNLKSPEEQISPSSEKFVTQNPTQIEVQEHSHLQENFILQNIQLKSNNELHLTQTHQKIEEIPQYSSNLVDKNNQINAASQPQTKEGFYLNKLQDNHHQSIKQESVYLPDVRQLNVSNNNIENESFQQQNISEQQHISNENIDPIIIEDSQLSPQQKNNNYLLESDAQYSPIQSLHIFMPAANHNKEQPTWQTESNDSVPEEKKSTPMKMQSPECQHKNNSSKLVTPMRLTSIPQKMTTTPQILENTPYVHSVYTSSSSPLVTSYCEGPAITFSNFENALPLPTVQVMYRSLNNPQYHFNIKENDFYKSPEKSKDSASCVFIHSGEKIPARIKIKYSPARELFDSNEFHESHIQEKYQIQNEAQTFQKSNAHQNSLQYLTDSINFLQVASGSYQQGRNVELN